MTPTEVANKILDLGISFQIERDGTPRVSSMNDLLDLLEKKQDIPEETWGEPEEKPQKKLVIVKDKETLLLYDGWRIAAEIPESINNKTIGTSILVVIDRKERKLMFRFDDIPYAYNAIVHAFQLEYITNIRLSTNETSKVIIIESIFGQTGIVLPLKGK